MLPDPAYQRPGPANPRPGPANLRPDPANLRLDPANLRPDPANPRPDLQHWSCNESIVCGLTLDIIVVGPFLRNEGRK